MIDNNEIAFSADLFFELLSKSTDNYVYMWDIQRNKFRISENAFDDFRITKEIENDIVGVWGAIMHPHDVTLWVEDIECILKGEKDYHDMEYRLYDKAGKMMWVSCRGKVERDDAGKPTIMVGRISNIGKQNKFDNNTGLRNREELEKYVNQLLSSDYDMQGAFIVLDVDNFKSINERYGHSFGDHVLNEIANRITMQLPHDVQLYRLEGDEFAFVLKNGKVEDVKSIFEKIQLFITNNFMMEDNHLFISVSAGACILPNDGKEFQKLYRHAESAVDVAKINGKNQLIFFSSEVHQRKLKFIEIQESLHTCIDHNFDEFELYYQPQVDTFTKEVVGAEALLRWHSKKHGEVSPVDFIPLLEESNLIIQVGKWVLCEAVKQCEKWQAYRKGFTMSINVSYIQLKENALMDYLCEGAIKKKFNSKTCILELTENCWIPDLEYLNKEFKSLQELGYSIAIDDFGTGYSSLNYLKSLPVNVIKIDRSFIQNIKEDSYEFTFLEYIIKLAHIIDLQVCVEGVETTKEYQIVKKTKPDFIQGFLFGRPVDMATFEKLHFQKNKKGT